MLRNASIITWPGILKNGLVASLVEACSRFDINLERISLDDALKGKGHFQTIEESKNSIAWLCYGIPQEEQKKKANILFFENGLLDRGRSFYLDDNGYGQFSNVVAKGYNTQPCSKEDINALDEKLIKAGWKKFPTVKDKIVMIALQSRYYSDLNLLQKCAKFIPKDAKVIIREHPLHRDKTVENYGKFCKEYPNWEIDTISDAFESLGRCRALIVNSSSMMYKALYMGISTAACERGFIRGSTAVLDCSRNESLLSSIFDFRFNQDATDRLLCGIDKSSISANATIDEVLLNTNFGNWLKRFRA